MGVRLTQTRTIVYPLTGQLDRSCDFPLIGQDGALLKGEPLDQGAGDVADGDVGLLNALRIGGGNVEEKIDFGTEGAAGFAGEGDQIRAAVAAGLYTADDVGAGAAGGEGNQDILRRDQGFDLAGEDALEAIVVAGGGEDGRIRGQRQGWEAGALGAEANNQLGGEVNGVRSAATVSEEDEFAARPQGRSRLLSERRDTRDQVVGKRLFDAGAFFQLSSDFISGHGGWRTV
jgi:hypothetical protein